MWEEKNDVCRNILKAPLNEMVCYCLKVSKGRILTAIQEGAREINLLLGQEKP
jgi:NAD(P)H-nitrite reductase large subunit